MYVNSDTNGRGFLGVGGSSHAMQHFASEAARDVKDPQTGASVLARALAKERVTSYDPAPMAIRVPISTWRRWARARTSLPSCSIWA